MDSPEPTLKQSRLARADSETKSPRPSRRCNIIDSPESTKGRLGRGDYMTASPWAGRLCYSVASGEVTMFQRRLGRGDDVPTSVRARRLCYSVASGEATMFQRRLGRVDFVSAGRHSGLHDFLCKYSRRRYSLTIAKSQRFRPHGRKMMTCSRAEVARIQIY